MAALVALGWVQSMKGLNHSDPAFPISPMYTEAPKFKPKSILYWALIELNEAMVRNMKSNAFFINAKTSILYALTDEEMSIWFYKMSFFESLASLRL